MAKIGELYVSITGDNSDLKAALGDSSKQVESFGSTVSKQVAGIVSITGILAGALKGIEFNKAAEQAQVAFTVMTGSAQKATKVLKDLKDFANKTPLEFKDLRQSTQTLIQFGVTAEDAVKTIKMLGDVSGGNAEKLQSLALAFGKVSAQGRVTGENVMMMIDAGFNPLKEISDRTGESMAALQKRMEAGKLSSEELTQSFKAATGEGGMFNGMLEKQGQTLAGAQSTFNDALDTFLGAAMEGATGPLTKAFQDLSKILSDLSPLVKDIGATFGNQLTFVLDIIKPVVALLSQMPSGLVAIGAELGTVAAIAKTVGANFGPWGIALTVAVGLLTQIAGWIGEIQKGVDFGVLKKYGLAWFDATKPMKDNILAYNDLRGKIQELQAEYERLGKKRKAMGELDQEDTNRLFELKEAIGTLMISQQNFRKELDKTGDSAKKAAAALNEENKAANKKKETIIELTEAQKKELAVQQEITDATQRYNQAALAGGYIDTYAAKQTVEANGKTQEATKKTFDLLGALQSANKVKSGNFLLDFLAKTVGTLGNVLKVHQDLNNGVIKSQDEANKQQKQLLFDYASAASEVLGSLLAEYNSAGKATLEARKQNLADIAQAEQDAQDEKNQAALDQIEIDYQNELYRAGLVGAETQAQMQEELDAAIAAGDEETAAKLRQSLEKLAIDEEYAAKRKAIEDQAAIDTAKREKDLAYARAQLDYQVKLKEWENAGLMNAVNTALGSIKAYATSSSWYEGLIAAIAISAEGVIAGAIIGANKPKPPAYAFGTDYHPGGAAIVGEMGRELVQLPAGAKVSTNSETNAILSGRGGTTITNNYYSPEALTASEMDRLARRNNQSLRMQGALA